MNHYNIFCGLVEGMANEIGIRMVKWKRDQRMWAVKGLSMEKWLCWGSMGSFRRLAASVSAGFGDGLSLRWGKRSCRYSRDSRLWNRLVSQLGCAEGSALTSCAVTARHIN